MMAQWTIMVYMAGNNSLSSAVTGDLREMRKVGSTEAVKMLTFSRQRGRRSAIFRQVGQGRTDQVVHNAGPLDSGNPQTVVDFVRWAMQTAPAERYALVLWNHGGGWLATDLTQLYSQVRASTAGRGLGGRDGGGLSRAELGQRANQRIARSLFSSSIQKVLTLGDVRAREVCSDDTTGHSLDTIEVENVLRLIAAELGRPLDLLGMDACLMSTLEVAYQVRDYVRALVGSEELEPDAGWPYDRIMRDLNGRPTMSGEELAGAVVRHYIDYYRLRPTVWPVTQCALTTAQLERLTGPLDALSTALRALPDTAFLHVFQAHLRAVRFERDMIDLQTFCRQLVDRPLGEPVVAAARAVLAALGPGGLVLAEGHLGPTVDGCGGISLYLPSPSDTISRFYADLRFAQRHSWDDLLVRYHSAV